VRPEVIAESHTNGTDLAAYDVRVVNGRRDKQPVHNVYLQIGGEAPASKHEPELGNNAVLAIVFGRSGEARDGRLPISKDQEVRAQTSVAFEVNEKRWHVDATGESPPTFGDI
jgi:hypothetical protein